MQYVNEAPVFRPTEAEWKSPMVYLEGIQEQAEKAGICKIVPPDNWRPPFAVDLSKFKFRTRKQNLCKIDGIARVERQFLMLVRQYLFSIGAPMGVEAVPLFPSPEHPESLRILRLYRLFQAVRSMGGGVQVSQRDKWNDVSKMLFYHIKKENEHSKLGMQLRQCYDRYLLSYEFSLETRKLPTFDDDSTTLQNIAYEGSCQGNMNLHNVHADLMNSAIASAIQESTSAADPKMEVEETEVRYHVEKPANRVGKRRGRPPSEETMAKRLRGVATTTQVVLKRFCPRLGMQPLPSVAVGARFFRYFVDLKHCLVGVVEELVNNDEWKIRYYASSDTLGKFHHMEMVDTDTAEMLLASGESEKWAEEALVEGICQICMRACKPENMILCDSCNSGYHSTCLVPSLRVIPNGDWFCAGCMKNFKENSAKEEIAEFGFEDGPEYTIEDYRDMANTFKSKYFETASRAGNLNIHAAKTSDDITEREFALEQEYWRLVSDAARGDTELVDIQVTYGSDLDTGVLGSGFPTTATLEKLKEQVGGSKNVELDNRIAEFEKYISHPWNLNKFPRLGGSLLQYVEDDITGVIVPWLYMGMFFSSFCWHTEDHNFASINYHHWGEPKTWYGVPASGAAKFEQACTVLTPELFEARADILTGIVTQFNPSELGKLEVPVYHLIQHQGDIVITFPKAYHGGFNHGLNCAEAVNFATCNWLPHGETSVQRYAKLKKNPVISHDALLCSLGDLCSKTAPSYVAHSLIPYFGKMIDRELKLRTLCSGLKPGMAAPLEDDAPGEKRTAGRMGRMVTSYGRERQHCSSGATKQCDSCRKFCSLSYVRSGEGKYWCLEHAQGSEMELVVLYSENELAKFLDDIRRCAEKPVRWLRYVSLILTDPSSATLSFEDFLLTETSLSGVVDLMELLQSPRKLKPTYETLQNTIKSAGDLGTSVLKEFNLLRSWIDKANNVSIEIASLLRRRGCSEDEWPYLVELKEARIRIDDLNVVLETNDHIVLNELIFPMEDWDRRNDRLTEPSEVQVAVDQVKLNWRIRTDVYDLLCKRLRSHEWVETALSLLSNEGSLSVAKDHVSVLENCEITGGQFEFTNGQIAFVNSFKNKVSMSDCWMSDYVKFTHQRSMGDLAALYARNDVSQLVFVDPADVEALKMDIEPVETWRKTTRSMLDRLTGNVIVKESQAEKLLEEGIALSLRCETDDVFDALNQVARKAPMEWRSRLAHSFSNQKDLKSQDVFSSREELVAKFLRQMTRNEINEKATPLVCLCRQPKSKGTTMICCTGCSEMYHPECLASSLEHLKTLAGFWCPTCILDGKRIKLNGKVGEYCYCGCSENDTRFMIECDECVNWFHPICVGISEFEAKQFEKYKCPDCCIREHSRPQISVYCVCRRPDFGTSCYKTEMVGCETCRDWFHPDCIKMKYHPQSSYQCDNCCAERDLPYIEPNGEHGYLAALNHYEELGLQKRPAGKVSVDNSVYEFEKCDFDEFQNLIDQADHFVVLVPELAFLRMLHRKIHAWIEIVPEYISLLSTREIWRLLFAEARLPVIFNSGPSLSLKYELLMRFTEELLMKKKKNSAEVRGSLRKDDVLILQQGAKNLYGFLRNVKESNPRKQALLSTLKRFKVF